MKFPQRSYFSIEGGTPSVGRGPLLYHEWRAFRAQLVARERELPNRPSEPAIPEGSRWAHEIFSPETGALLVAKSDTDMGLYSQAVILLTDHKEEGGTAGLVLNIPITTYSKKEGIIPSLIGHLGMKDERFTSAFGPCPILYGGPNDVHLLSDIHARRDLAYSSVEILPGVYAGGIDDGTKLVLNGKAAPHEFRLYSGHCLWYSGQLVQELADGRRWSLVAASHTLVQDLLTDMLCWDPRGLAARGATEVEQVGLGIRQRCWEKVKKAARLDDKQQWSA
jgi:putative AlgH/UPF0301 family transcriptional regulator